MPLLKPPSESEIAQQLKSSPRILRGGDGDLSYSEQELIPFVPAFDLLERSELELDAQEAACVALALSELLPAPAPEPSLWHANARREAIYKD